MPRNKKIPDYSTVNNNGKVYYRTRIKDLNGKRIALYGKTKEELYIKETEARQRIADGLNAKEHPTVKTYGEKWLKMQSAYVEPSTMVGYEYQVRKYIIEPLGDMYLADVKLDDIKMALLPVSKLSESMYHSVHMLVKCIFNSAEQNHLLKDNPTKYLKCKGGVPKKERAALTDEQVQLLLETIKGLPPYVFVMIGLYAGLRREEILALKWDCVFLDGDTPYLSVRRAWHAEHNRPVITEKLKTKAARREIPLPDCLAECLREAKLTSKSEYVIANSEGQPLSYTQFQRVWKYISTRSDRERVYVRYVNGQRIKHKVTPVLGERAAHNKNVIYTLNFHVTPHQLRHTYITNLIYASVDPKTVQYLAGHEQSKITMDIYAKVKYNRPEELSEVVNKAFNQRSAE